MQVETYEATETYDGEPENRDDAFALVVELGLNGQERFFSTSDDQGMPYRKMTAEEYRVYNSLLPRLCELKDYSEGPIPVRVLQIAAHANQYFEKLYVMYEPNADDPVLWGKPPGKEEKFILARWGNVLLPMPELRKQAGAKFLAEVRKECADGIAKLKARMEAAAEMDPEQAILSGMHLPYVSADRGW